MASPPSVHAARPPGLRRQAQLTGAFLGGPVLRITDDGFALQTERPPRVGEEYPCELHLGDEVLNLSGRVDWCLLKRMEPQANGDSRAVYWAGITVESRHLAAYRRAVATETFGDGRPVS